MEKGVPSGFPLWDVSVRRGKLLKAARRRDKARVRGRTQLEPGSRGAPTLRAKSWMPWNGLIVIWKRMELLGRNTQKPTMWDPKLVSEYWRLEDVEKVLKEVRPD